MEKFKGSFISFTALLLIAGLMFSCKPEIPSDLTTVPVIPLPSDVTANGEYFSIKPGTDILLREKGEEIEFAAQFLADILTRSTGVKADVRVTDSKPQSGSIVFLLDESLTALGEEGYELDINKRILTLSAARPAGLFRGVQTIRQLLPPAIEADTVTRMKWQIAGGKISDYPEYAYRGVMIDVSRHFFSKEDIKRVIDHIAYYKMNMLHLHLSDDQGWRIEITSWPNLALHGGSTEVGGGEGGYYTRGDYSEIVEYAADRHITIVPEIDMPGHTNAALASYAELNCNGKATELYTGTRVGFSSLCVDKEITYKFVDDVVGEISELTPGPYFHIGGDESHATKENDYILFINKIQDIVVKYNKLIVGWDEIALSNLKPNSVAHFWANEQNARLAVEKGAKLIMSPAKKAYLDMKYTRETKLGLRWAGLIEVDTAYLWDPATYIEGVGRENILGIEAPLWTETITNMEEMEYMIFPRLPGYAEIGWTKAADRNWDEYRIRLGAHAERFNARKVNFYRSPLVEWKE